MKKILQMFCLLVLIAAAVQKKKKVVFFGDSITEQAVKPKGFIVQIDSMLQKNNLKEDYDLVGGGGR